MSAEEITQEQFIKLFLESIYYSEINGECHKAEEQLTELLVKTLNSLVNERGFKFKLKRFSKTFETDVKFVNVKSLIEVKINGVKIFAFLRYQQLTHDFILKRILTKILVAGANFKLELDQVTLEQLVDLIDTAIKNTLVEKSRLHQLITTKYQEQFELTSGCNLTEIYNVYFNYSPGAMLELFARYKFTEIPNLEKIPLASARANKTFHSINPMHGWELMRKPDGYGHECGSAVSIDWFNRKIVTYGWSSDD